MPVSGGPVAVVDHYFSQYDLSCCDRLIDVANVTLGYIDDPFNPLTLEEAGYWRVYLNLAHDMPFIGALLGWNASNYPWVLYVFLLQAYQILFNLTTNEMSNAGRYPYMKVSWLVSLLRTANDGVFRINKERTTIRLTSVL